MLRWFGGSAPGARTAQPNDARMLWNDPPLWTVGHWPAHLLRTAETDSGRIAVFGSCSASDNDIAHAANLNDPATVLHRWAGSFTAVRTRTGAVDVFADGAHACPLYTVTTPQGLVWGSSALALAPLASSRVDTEWLAAYLWDKRAPVASRSPWTNIIPVRPGHRVMLTPDGCATTTPWWSPSTRTYAEATARLRHLLTAGVRARTSVPVSTDLAGLDSTTLAIIAAAVSPTPVTAITAHPDGQPIGGDLTYAAQLTVPGLTRILLPLHAGHLPFTPADIPLPATDEPAPSTMIWTMFSAQLRLAIAAGATAHLTGDGGDNLALPPPTHLTDLVRTGRWLRAAADLMDWARLRRIDPRPLARAALQANARRLAHPTTARPPWLTAPPPPPPPGMPNRSTGDANTELISNVRTAARAAYADAQLADALKIELHNPYFDAAVLETAVSAPASARFSAHRYKPLLLDAAGDLLPEPHRNRTTKGTFVSAFHHGARTNLPHLLDQTDRHLAALGLINPALLRTALHHAALGVETPWATLLRTLAAEAWLATLEATPDGAWLAKEAL
ncbi:albusnodin/ikarugamycin family macrolactam cyclase [Streptomyces roseoverticillatus]|uniref:albusnodin/ikarugamycin family macrolactam cyclase n=1 Tax=Streptomyces roseoverticillatus TaxID=66429 RepID=UPI0033F903FB